MDDLFIWTDRRNASPPDGIPDHICDLFEELALKVHHRGWQHYSARAILHQMRWHHQVERGDVDFKINNNYSARLARWFMAKHAHMDGFFELRYPAHEDEPDDPHP